MDIGGNAFNRGIQFAAGTHRVRVEQAADGTYVFRTTRERFERSFGLRWLKRLERIPFLRGVARILQVSRLFVLILVIAAVLDGAEILSGQFARYGADSLLRGLDIVYCLVTAGLLIYLVKNLLHHAKKTRQYHGAEHKVINACCSGEPLTLESARNASRVSKRCGTEWVVFFLLFYVPLEIITALASISFLAASAIGYEIFNLKKGDEIPLISLLFRFGYFCQRRFFTSEPTDEQLAAAVKAVQLLQQQESNGKKN